MDVVRTWTSDGSAVESGWKCSCQEIAEQHPQMQLVDGHVACSAGLLTLTVDLQELASSSANNSVYLLADGAWMTFRHAITTWTQDHDLLCLPVSDLRSVWEEWEEAWEQHETSLGHKWTVSDVLRLKACAPQLI